MTTPTLADALRQCRNALHDVAIDCAIECKNAEARDTIGSRRATRVALAAANVKTLEDAMALADAALAAADAASQPPADERAAFEQVMKKAVPILSMQPDNSGGYVATTSDIAWMAWQARASLAQPPAAPTRQPDPNPEPMIDGWPLYSMLPPPPNRQGEVPMPEPVGAVIPEDSTEYADCVTLAQCRAYGDARALAAVREPLSDAAIVAAARALNKLHSEACGVDAGDSWTHYSGDFKADALIVLTATAQAQQESRK